MLKFKGKRKDFKNFSARLVEEYGAKTTIKEIVEMIGARANVSM